MSLSTKLKTSFKNRLVGALRSGLYEQVEGRMRTRTRPGDIGTAEAGHFQGCFYGVWLDLMSNGASWAPGSGLGGEAVEFQFGLNKQGHGNSVTSPTGADDDWWEEHTGIRNRDPQVNLTEEEWNLHNKQKDDDDEVYANAYNPEKLYSLMSLNDKGYTFEELGSIVDRAL